MAKEKVGLVRHPQLINIYHSTLFLFAIHKLVHGRVHFIFLKEPYSWGH